MRRLEIIGEAAKKLRDDFKQNRPQVAWREITGTRDILIHEYFGVDLELLWQVVEKDLKVLKAQISELLST